MSVRLSVFGANAVAYCEYGIAVFPLQVREKKPYGSTSGLYGASADPALAVERWSGRAALPLKPDARPGTRVFASGLSNIGVATGAASGFWVLDLDGPEAEAALAALVAVHGPLPATVEQSTGRGRHLCFLWDPAAEIRNSSGKIGPKIDVRGNGGYIVAPPSIHPSGRVYAWTQGRSPWDLPFAAAPEWLIKLAAPPARQATPAPNVSFERPRRVEGRASRYGEVALDNAVATIRAARVGSRDTTLYKSSFSIGRLVGGGEIELDYARQELISAGAVHVPDAMSEAQLVRQVDRALANGADDPKSAPERPAFRPVSTREDHPTPDRAAAEIRDARGLWDASLSADCGAVRSWLKFKELEPRGLPGVLGRMRAHAAAPIGRGERGPALLAPLVLDPAGTVDALAILPLAGDAEGFVGFIGDAFGRVIVLVPPMSETLIAQTLQDAWALGQNAFANGHELGVVIAPTLETFAGGALGDKYGRVDPSRPHADEAAPAWTVKGVETVYLAIRDDVFSPELKVRCAFGGTARVVLQGDDAARFYGGLAEQSWTRAGASAARILRPSAGRAGFNDRGI